jgi:DNA-binding transcriptional regulator YiaG
MEKMMSKRRTNTTKSESKGRSHVVDGQLQRTAVMNTLETFDATALVGLRTHVMNAAIEHIDERGESTIELPKLRELLATAAVSRCLMPIRIRGSELRMMRRLMKLTLADLAGRLDERTAPETVSRWESEAQPMGGYVEKLIRLIVCEELSKEAPGVEYSASKIAHLRVTDPWRMDPDYEVPAIELKYVPMKVDHAAIIDTWAA